MSTPAGRPGAEAQHVVTCARSFSGHPQAEAVRHTRLEAGKSSLVDELVIRFLIDFTEKTVGII